MIILFVLIQIFTIISSHFTNIEKICLFALNCIIWIIIMRLKKENKKNKTINIIQIFIIIFAFTVTIFGGYFGRFIYCTGCSMMPTFSKSGVIAVIIYKNAPFLGFDDLNIGDVGIFRVYQKESENYGLYSKRVVGKVTDEGADNIYIKDGLIYNNDEIVVNYPGCQDLNCTEKSSEKKCIFCQDSLDCVEEGHGMYFVLGDNFHKSVDSRSFGLICEEDVYGRIIIAIDVPQKNISYYPK
ncbi:signal peptidase I [Acetoanaerobium pronyense]|uniref:Signal peptidase I n=1 Tax=Acetoanaerobium pronyense TaxID=1482736 RepID=A0ABS4KM63_9FIRM|nr:signal peptidase I [Acetoanaerobium pronyense]MBP2028877.1 signal peptidase I [Acetoanaerobium pronyense]